VCGGLAVSFVSTVLLRNTDYAFWQVCVGYTGFACVTGMIYGGALRVMAYALRRVPADDARRAFATGAITTAAQYALTTVLGNQSDRMILIAAPVCAAAFDALRARRARLGLARYDADLPAVPAIIEPSAVEPRSPEHTE
jgi:hypothetical protein